MDTRSTPFGKLRTGSLSSGMSRLSRASALPQMFWFRVKRCLLLVIKNLCYPDYAHALTSMDSGSAPFGKLSKGSLAFGMTKQSRASALPQVIRFRVKRCLFLVIQNLCYPDYAHALTSMDSGSAPFGKLSTDSRPVWRGCRAQAPSHKWFDAG